MSISYPNRPEFDYTMQIEKLKAQRVADYARQPWIGFVVSEAWADRGWLTGQVDQIASKYPKATLVVPERAVGAAHEARQSMIDHNLTIIEVRTEGTWGDHRQAVQASMITKLSDIILVAWAGGTDIADSVAKKALLVHRPEDRYLPGLHVYEMVLEKKRIANGQDKKGKTKWKVEKKPTGKHVHKIRKGTKLVEST